MRHSLTTMVAALLFAVAGCTGAERETSTKAQSTPTLWVVEQRNLWGDYGVVLISGYAHRETEGGPLSLHRTGPFLPPISFPWVTGNGGHDIVVSAQFKVKLVALNHPDITFREAAKARVIRLPWEGWNLTAPNPAKYPDEPGPESYIWDKKHDAKCAAEMSAAYELVLPVGPVDVDRVENPDAGYLDEFTTATIPAAVPPMGRSHRSHGYMVVDDQMKEWLEKHAGDWVRFSPVRPAKSE